jgi:hypothetical protein
MQLKKELRSRGFCEPSKDRVIVSAHVRGRSVAGSAHRIEGDVREEKISQAKCCAAKHPVRMLRKNQGCFLPFDSVISRVPSRRPSRYPSFHPSHHAADFRCSLLLRLERCGIDRLCRRM